MMKHTKGPWRVDERGVVWALASSCDDDDVCIAHTRSYNVLGEQAEANARLLAVAPDLASALADVLKQINGAWLLARAFQSHADDASWPTVDRLQIAVDKAYSVLDRINTGKSAKAATKERLKKTKRGMKHGHTKTN